MIKSPCKQCKNQHLDKDLPPCDGCALLSAVQAEDARRFREDVVYRAQLKGYKDVPHPEDVNRCAVEGCSSPVLCRGLCSAHYQAARRRAAALSGRPAPPPARGRRPPGHTAAGATRQRVFGEKRP